MTDQIRGGFARVSRSWRLTRSADPALDLRRGRGLVAQPGDGPRVVLGLEQAVHELDLKGPDGRGRGLQPQVVLEPVGQDVAVPGPPVGPGRTADQGARNLDALCSSVTPYKASRSATSRTLNPTRPVSIRLIFDRDARISCRPARRDTRRLAKAAQLRAEQHAQDKTVERRVIQARIWLLAARHLSIHAYCSDADRPALRVPASGPGSPKHIATRKALPIERITAKKCAPRSPAANQKSAGYESACTVNLGAQ